MRAAEYIIHQASCSKQEEEQKQPAISQALVECNRNEVNSLDEGNISFGDSDFGLGEIEEDARFQ